MQALSPQRGTSAVTFSLHDCVVVIAGLPFEIAAQIWLGRRSWVCMRGGAMQAYARGRQDGCGAVQCWGAFGLQSNAAMAMMMEREAVALAAWCQLENY